jgi:hypothetical protein
MDVQLASDLYFPVVSSALPEVTTIQEKRQGKKEIQVTEP